MKALILAPGDRLGMQPLTDILPTPMVPVMNQPLLFRALEHLKKNGINQIVICTRSGQNYLENYFRDGSQFGITIEYVQCAGGPFERDIPVFNETFIVLEPDILSNIDLLKMARLHKSRGASVTIAAGSMFSPHDTCTGVYILEPEMIAALDHSVWADRGVLRKALANAHGAVVYKNHDYLMVINTVEKYKQAHIDNMRGKCRLDDFNEGGGKVILGKNVRIHPTARLIGSVCIGDHVEIGAMARISDSVIGSDSFIGCESNILDSILWDHVNVKSNARLVKTVVLSGATVPVSKHSINTVISPDEQTYPANAGSAL